MGWKFKYSAQDSDLEYLCWRCKNYPVSFDLKPPLTESVLGEIDMNMKFDQILFIFSSTWPLQYFLKVA